MSSLYQAKRIQPYHISVGGLAHNAEGKILVHKRMRAGAPEQFAADFFDREELYLLMRESLEGDETLEQAVHRGLHEEFGAKGIVENFLGSLQTIVPGKGDDWSWQKTTLYFSTLIAEAGERKRDEESFSVLEWHDPAFLLGHMKGQGGARRPDLDESTIVERYVALLKML